MVEPVRATRSPPEPRAHALERQEHSEISRQAQPPLAHEEEQEARAEAHPVRLQGAVLAPRREGRRLPRLQS